jgi:hypothetical protein
MLIHFTLKFGRSSHSIPMCSSLEVQKMNYDDIQFLRIVFIAISKRFTRGWVDKYLAL